MASHGLQLTVGLLLLELQAAQGTLSERSIGVANIMVVVSPAKYLCV